MRTAILTDQTTTTGSSVVVDTTPEVEVEDISTMTTGVSNAHANLRYPFNLRDSFNHNYSKNDN